MYPFESPGGWNLLGRTPVPLFDPGREESIGARSAPYGPARVRLEDRCGAKKHAPGTPDAPARSASC